jgi:hypothetical protein
MGDQRGLSDAEVIFSFTIRAANQIAPLGDGYGETDADPDIPILKEAKAEYAKLQ